jgi:hypothetical protein
MGIGRALRRALDSRRLHKAIRSARRTALADVAEGELVRVTGIARPLGPALEAPLSLRACVYYDIVIHAWDFEGRVRAVGGEHERTVFSLVDGEQRVVVDPERARVSSTFDHVTKWRPSDRPPAEVCGAPRALRAPPASLVGHARGRVQRSDRRAR